jgi:small subunit ribosomal protein S20
MLCSLHIQLIFRRSTLANSAQAKKRARQAEDSRQRNASQRSAMRTRVKALQKAIDAGDKEQATIAYQSAVPVLDRMARKGIIHKNAAARSKSRLNAAVRAL